MNERYVNTNEYDRNEPMNNSARRFRSEAQPSSRAGNSASRIDRLFAEKNQGAPARYQPAAGENGGGTIIYSPSTYEDVQLLIDHLKRREQVIVDFSDINQTSVYRILDFMSGAIYALGGSIQQITKNIFLFAPNGVTITVPPQLGRK
jgi:cell division inhibitor SepF